MSPVQQRGLALWAALLSAVVCLAFLPLSRLASVLVLLAMIGVIVAFWYIARPRAEHDASLRLDDLPETTYRQPVVLVCGDMPLTWPQQSPVLTVTQGCWIRVEDHQDLEQVARQVLLQRPDWGRQLSVMVSVCPQKHVDSEALTSRLLALRWQISQLRKETGHSVPLIVNGQIGSAMTDDMLWQAAIPGEGWTVWRESNAPCSIAAWVTTGGAPVMQQQVLMNSLMSWFHQHLQAVFIDDNPDVPAIAPAAMLWGMGPILAGSLASSAWTAWLSRHTAMQQVSGWHPVGTDSTVISPLPDFILPQLPEGGGLTPRARTWRCVLGIFTLAAITALLCSGWNNRQLLHRVSFDSAYERNPAPESGAFYARIRHERYLNGQTRTRAITSSPALSPGMLLKVTGGYEVAEVFAQGVVITAMQTHARRDEDFSLRFDGIPDSPDFSFRPEPGERPVMAGTLPARVTSTTENDTYGHIDKDGRYRVNMLFDRESWETGFESLWVRQSRPYAGDTYGLHLPLLAGTEVAIGFEDGNPDRPYIAGVLHDSAHGDHVTIRNYKRNVLRTPANNKIRLDDERGKEHIKVSTEYGGKSQLNLGHLVDSEKQQRGEGFELRTDSWGAIRAQKGIFISADGQARAQGQVLEMQAAVSNLGDARAQMQAISDDAQTATANPADLQAQITLLEQQLTDLKKSVLLMSAPDGVALTSGEHLQVSAGQNLIATAGKNADVSVVKNLFIGVGSALSVFVRKLGIRLIANQGPVQVSGDDDASATE
ncbi:TPA: DUF2345 domain-containing protein [Enterobacter bugandensis]